jgi:hypothetical protein
MAPSWFKDYNKRCNRLLKGSGAHVPDIPKRKVPNHYSFMSTMSVYGEYKGDTKRGILVSYEGRKAFEVANTAILEWTNINMTAMCRVTIPAALAAFIIE